MKLFRNLLQRMKQVHMPSSGSDAAELFPGVVKPSLTLANLVCAKLLSDEFKPQGNSATFEKFSLTWQAVSRDWTKCSKAVLTEACDHFSKSRGYREGFYHPSEIVRNRLLREHVTEYLRTRCFEGCEVTQPVFPDVVFSDYEKSLINEALFKALDLHKKRQANQSLYDNQQKAVDTIALLMGVPSTPDPSTPEIGE